MKRTRISHPDQDKPVANMIYKELIQMWKYVIQCHNDKIEDMREQYLSGWHYYTDMHAKYWLPDGLEWLEDYFHKGMATYNPITRSLDLSAIMNQSHIKVDDWIDIDARVIRFMDEEATSCKHWVGPEERGIYSFVQPSYYLRMAAQMNIHRYHLQKQKLKYKNMPYYQRIMNDFQQISDGRAPKGDPQILIDEITRIQNLPINTNMSTM